MSDVLQPLKDHLAEWSQAREAFASCRERLLERTFAKDIVTAMGESGEPMLEPMLYASFLEGWRARAEA